MQGQQRISVFFYEKYLVQTALLFWQEFFFILNKKITLKFFFHISEIYINVLKICFGCMNNQKKDILQVFMGSKGLRIGSH